MLPNKDVVKIVRLPETLADNSANLDVWSSLREPNAENNFESIQDLLDKLLSTGGKLIPGAAGSKLYIGPCELAAFMKELIEIINSDEKPNSDSLVDGIVNEKKAKFDKQILEYAEEQCKNIAHRDQLETDDDIRELNEQMDNYRKNLTQKSLGEMIRAARFQLLGIDAEKINKEFRTMDKQKEAAKQLPAIIQKELLYIEERMNAFREPEEKINEARSKD